MLEQEIISAIKQLKKGKLPGVDGIPSTPMDGMAKSAFVERKELLTSRLSLALKKKIVETVIWPVLLYGCETWTLR